jgi:hypothetical protein
MAQDSEKFEVWRQDDNGNKFVVQKNLSREAADKLAKELENRGHKQVYWVQEEEPAA